MRILAADDERGALQLLKQTIAEVLPQAELMAFNEPEDAIEYEAENPCDIAFLDIEMGTMSGLEAAKQLKRHSPKINIIFVTGYSEYMRDAISLHASGYITKPVTADEIRREVDNLMHPIEAPQKVRIQCFGHFELFVDGQPVSFTRAKSRELLALLVHNRGAALNRKEIAATLFEDKPYNLATQNYLTQVVRSLEKGLQEAGAPGLFIHKGTSYHVDTAVFSCDAYDYLNGVPTAINKFQGSYMEQYSWAEEGLQQFYE